MNKLILLLYVAIYLCIGILLLNISFHTQVSENTWNTLIISEAQLNNAPAESFFAGKNEILYRRSEIMQPTDQYLDQISAILHQEEEIGSEHVHRLLALRDSITNTLSRYDDALEGNDFFTPFDDFKAYESLDARVKAHHLAYMRQYLPYIRHQVIEALRERRGLYEIEHSALPSHTLAIPDRLHLDEDQPVGVTLALGVAPFYEGQVIVNGQSFPVHDGVAWVRLPLRDRSGQYPLTMEATFADTVLRIHQTIFVESGTCQYATKVSK